MFRALTCPSSGGQIELSQHLVSYTRILKETGREEDRKIAGEDQ